MSVFFDGATYESSSRAFIATPTFIQTVFPLLASPSDLDRVVQTYQAHARHAMETPVGRWGWRHCRLRDLMAVDVNYQPDRQALVVTARPAQSPIEEFGQPSLWARVLRPGLDYLYGRFQQRLYQTITGRA